MRGWLLLLALAAAVVRPTSTLLPVGGPGAACMRGAALGREGSVRVVAGRAGSLRGGGGRMDAGGDSLMGWGASEEDRDADADDSTVCGREDLMAQLQGLRRFDPRKAATWPAGTPAPLSFVCERLRVVEEHLSSGSRDKALDSLCNLLRTLIVASPSDVAPLVCMLRDQVLSPALSGVELVSSTVLLKVIADSSGVSMANLKAAISAASGDIPAVACGTLSSQSRLFPPPPLTLSAAYSRIRELALLGGREHPRKYELTKRLMINAQGEELRFLLRCMLGTLRKAGYSTSTVLGALSRAAILESQSRPSTDGLGAEESASGQEGWAAEELEGTLHEAVAQVPSLATVVSALLENGPGGLLSSLNMEGRRGAGMRGRTAKRSALQAVREVAEVEMAGSREAWAQAGLVRASCDVDLEELEAAAGAAWLSGLQPQRLTIYEERLIPESLAKDTARALALRNHILLRHRRHALSGSPGNFLSEQDACAGVDPHNEEDARLVFRALSMLGHVNPAQALLMPAPPLPAQNHASSVPRVIVIGAGYAGVCAAKKLSVDGFQVILLEASDKIGGRVKGITMGGANVELGAMAITGSNGNPLVDVANGVRAGLYPLREGCTLYQMSGLPLAPKLDAAAERVFNAFLDLVPTQTSTKLRAAARSAADKTAEDLLTSERPRGATAQRNTIPLYASASLSGAREHCVHDQGVRELLQQGAPDFLTKQAGHTGMAQDEGKVGSGESVHSSEDFGAHAKGEERAKDASLGSFIEQMIEDEKQKAADGKSKLGHSDWATAAAALRWHVANLEFAIGAPLWNVSRLLWNADDAYLFSGAHYSVPKGLGSLLPPLVQGVDVRLEHQVLRVEYGSDQEGVRVTALCPGGKEVTLDADRCVVTVPLGVLKAGKPSFDPPLPSWKRRAIDGMGFGLLNKVALRFDSAFWGESSDLDYMGFLQEDPLHRGLCYMFCNLEPATKQPVLLALLAGEAASMVEGWRDEEVVESAMAALRRVFREKAQDPVEFQVTRWGQEEFVRGAYSFTQPGSKALHHEALAREVDDRVFFAGEHTSKTHPAQVIGALMSGILAAGRVGSLLGQHGSAGGS